MNQIHYEHIKLLLVTPKGIVTSQVTTCSCTVVCALAMHGGILKNSITQKSYQEAGSVLFIEGTVPMVIDSLGQWRKSYHDITTKTSCVKYTWSPTSQWYLQASPAGACLHDKLQSYGGSTMNAWTPSTNLLCQIHSIPNSQWYLQASQCAARPGRRPRCWGWQKVCGTGH